MSAASIAALLVGLTGFLTAVVALSKRRPEITHVLVSSASEVVIMQRDLLAESNDRIDRLERKMVSLQSRVSELSASRDEALGEVESLKKRVKQLEDHLRLHDIPIPPVPGTPPAHPEE